MLHPKQARYQASLQPEPQEQRLDSSTRTSATFRDSRASRLARSPKALALPRRYQATINLLKTHDKLARGRDLMAARLGRLPHRYLFECHGCCGALCVVRVGLENSNKGKEFVWA